MAKRLFDVVVGVVLALIAVPLILALALVVAVSLRTWPLFVQHRVGRGGRLFRLVKLRTLPPSTPPYADKYAIEGIHLPRLIQAMRRTHLDELPQLFLVPLGRMSLVGPRPEMPPLHARFAPAFAEGRTQVRPGCTGLWQVGAGCQRLIEEAPEYDDFYLRHRNLRLDLFIVGRTIGMALRRRSLVTLGDVPLWARRRPVPVAGVAPATPLGVRLEPEFSAVNG